MPARGAEEGHRVSLYHSPLSREELVEYEDALRALALAHRAIAMACVGVTRLVEPKALVEIEATAIVPAED